MGATRPSRISPWIVWLGMDSQLDLCALLRNQELRYGSVWSSVAANFRAGTYIGLPMIKARVPRIHQDEVIPG